MRGKIVAVVSILSLFGMLFMMNYLAPRNAGVFGVLVFFTMIFLFLFGVISWTVKIFQRLLKDKKGGKVSESKTYMYSTVLAFGPVILLVTRSASILTLAMVGLFMFLGCFLIHKRA